MFRIIFYLFGFRTNKWLFFCLVMIAEPMKNKWKMDVLLVLLHFCLTAAHKICAEKEKTDFAAVLVYTQLKHICSQLASQAWFHHFTYDYCCCSWLDLKRGSHTHTECFTWILSGSTQTLFSYHFFFFGHNHQYFFFSNCQLEKIFNLPLS